MSGILGGQAILLMLVHLVGDFYGSFYYPLVPYLRERLGLTLTATAGLAALLAAATSYFQPVAGVIGERLGRRATLVTGVLGATIGMCLLGVVWNFASLCALLVLGGLGVGLYHPVGAAAAGRLGAGNRVAAIAVYVVGGQIGVMLAPLAVPRVAAVGMPWLAVLALPGIIFAAVLWARLRVEDTGPRRPNVRAGDVWRVFRKLWTIHLNVVLRFIPAGAYGVMLPLYCTLRGLSKAAAGQSLAFSMLMGAFGILSGGYVAARVSNRALVALSELASGVCLVLAPMTEGVAFYALLGAGSFLLWMVTPVQIAAAQKLAPRTEGTASGIVMGLAAGNAGLMLIPIGWLGDHWSAATGSEVISVQRMLQVSAAFLFVAAAATLFRRSEPYGAPDDGKE